MQRKSRGGSVAQDRRTGVWNYFWWDNGKRRSKVIGSFPSKTAAWNAAQVLKERLRSISQKPVVNVSSLVNAYRAERMPQRYSTQRSYNVWLRLYILPRWADSPVTDLQARPVEMWLQSLELSPRSKSSIRGMLRGLWEHAMWRGDIATQRNPIELVKVKGTSKRTRHPRSLTVDEFQKLVTNLEEPFYTMALVCVCFGLRISEALGLKWSDVDWLNGRLRVERGIVRQRLGDTKTEYSNRPLVIDVQMSEVLKRWKQVTEFPADGDWIFASPAQLGRLPWSADSLNDAYRKAGEASGVRNVSTHTMRHTYRSWLDAVGTRIAVQQKLMRHADIRTTMNIYGDIVTDEMAVASGRVARLALNGRETAGKAS